MVRVRVRVRVRVFCCKVCLSTRYLDLPCFSSFLIVESTNELNEKDLFWSKKNLEETTQVDSVSAPNKHPKKRSRLVSLVNLYHQYYSGFVWLCDCDILFSDVTI